MNFQDIIDSERQMIMEANKKYGTFFTNSLEFVSLTQEFIAEAKIDSWMFQYFFAYMKKHQLLSWFSMLRRHHVQSFLDLRQVIEATSLACYALAFPDNKVFATQDEHGILYIPKNLISDCYSWIENNYPEASEALMFAKKEINKTCAHCNLIYAMYHSNLLSEKNVFEHEFFDNDDPDLINGDLWFLSLVSGNVMDIFYGVNRKYSQLTFSSDFVVRLKANRITLEKLRNEMREKERFKKWKPILTNEK